MSKCKYPNCEHGQFGTYCENDCIESVFHRADKEFVRFNLTVLGVFMAGFIALCIWRPWA